MPRRMELMPLATIRGAVRNPKRHDTAGIAASLGEFGLAELPLYDERTGRLVAGHGRINDLRARHAAGHAPPDGIEVDPAGGWLIPVVRGWSSKTDAHAEAYLAASNQLTVNGGWDATELVAMLLDVQVAGLLDVSGFDSDDIDKLLHDDDPPLGDGDDDFDDDPQPFGVVVLVDDEDAQDALLRDLLGRGHQARTLAAARLQLKDD